MDTGGSPAASAAAGVVVALPDAAEGGGGGVMIDAFTFGRLDIGTTDPGGAFGPNNSADAPASTFMLLAGAGGGIGSAGTLALPLDGGGGGMGVEDSPAAACDGGASVVSVSDVLALLVGGPCKEGGDMVAGGGTGEDLPCTAKDLG